MKKTSPLDQPITIMDAIGKLKWLGGAIASFAIFVGAWTYLQGPVPATRDYVDSSVNKVVTRIDQVDILGLTNRIETLKARKGQLDQERVGLELQTKQTKDPVAIQIISNRRGANIDDTSQVTRSIVDTEDQIKTLSLASQPRK